jgi:hypothetical protein
MNELQVYKAGERKRRKQTPFETNRAAGDTSKRATVWALIATLTLSSLTPFVPLAGAQQTGAQQAGAQPKLDAGSATAGLPPEPEPNATLPVYRGCRICCATARSI